MKIAVLPLAALLAFAVVPGSAIAADPTSPAEARTGPMQDISAAKKKYKRHHARRYAPAYGYQYGYRYGWRPGDPTAGPNSLLSFYRRNNICAIDEGYGRATRCN